jgi:glycerophosphoryl diester phosphodiesterase
MRHYLKPRLVKPEAPVVARAETLLLRFADGLASAHERQVPPAERLAACRIISHRGEHDNRRVMENSLPAFDAAVRAGVWGLELDVRWTRDRCPVVFHDPDLKRIFGAPESVGELTRADIERRFAAVPALETVVARYGKRRHLMIELKGTAGLSPADWSRALKRVMAPLEPVTDYHFISLDADLFAPVDWVPAAAFLPIGRLNLRSYSRLALSRGFGGVTGHYLLLTRRMAAAHHRRGQKVGTGFPASQNILFREIMRGVDWVFSDRAAHLQAVCERHCGGNPTGRASSSASARPFSSSTK